MQGLKRTFCVVIAMGTLVGPAVALPFHWSKNWNVNGASGNAKGCTSSGTYGVYHFVGHVRSGNIRETIRWDEHIVPDNHFHHIVFTGMTITGAPPSSVPYIKSYVRSFYNHTTEILIRDDRPEVVHYHPPSGRNFNLVFNPRAGC